MLCIALLLLMSTDALLLLILLLLMFHCCFSLLRFYFFFVTAAALAASAGSRVRGLPLVQRVRGCYDCVERIRARKAVGARACSTAGCVFLFFFWRELV
jgi:hypothetical protein